jgi:hypothetical protein
MSAFDWLKSLWGAPVAGSVAIPPPGADALEHARSLARSGRLQEASQAYWSIKRKLQSVEGLVEHAELLLELGDYFAAASRASAARVLDPDNPRAQAVQRTILAREKEEEELRR